MSSSRFYLLPGSFFLGVALASIVLVSVAFGENTLIQDDTGRSAIIQTGDDPLVILRDRAAFPETGGFYRKKNVWVNSGEVRLTTYEQQLLVFLGPKRVATLPLSRIAELSEGESLYQYSEQGFTLRLNVLNVDAAASVETNVFMHCEVLITRP